MKTMRAVLYMLAMVGFAAPCVAAVTEGSLQAVDKDKHPLGFCPLKHTEVNVDISGFIARVTLTQDFGNPFQEPIEAIYTFPMSDRGAVDSMTMTIGERVVKGLIKKREEAQRIYQEAKNAGKTASLLDQERPNIFTQSVANIMPGESILITISYVEYLKFEEGLYEFSFPMVVGPRYIPGAQPQPPDAPLGPVKGTAQVPDAERITPAVTPEGTRAGHDIALTVRLDAGLPIQDIKSELHEVDVERPADSKAVVSLKNKKEIPNRDFVLRYAVSGKKINDAVLTHADAKGGFFTLILQPPDRVTPEQAAPKEMMFVIDCSGSMRGFPIEKAKKTMRLCIEQMNPKDTFNLVSFSGGMGYCFSGPVPNTEENRKKALEYLANLEGSGGTEMMPAIRAALENQNDPERLRMVCFMTDGFIGNDMEILDAVRKNAKTARVFAFGIGNGVNRFLIEGMARLGRGALEIVNLESDGDAAAKRFHERTQCPVLTDITVDFGGLPVKDVYPDPDALPDLFSSQPVVLKGRYEGSHTGTITLRGKTVAGPFERTVPVTLPAEEAAHDVLAPLWARERIAWLMDQDWLGAQRGTPDDKVKDEVTKLGLDFSLVTQYTSFVAVEEKIVNENGKPKTVHVPVEMTDGVSYEGVFGEETVKAKVSAGSAYFAAPTQLGSGFANENAPMKNGINLPESAAAPRAMRRLGAADSALGIMPPPPPASPPVLSERVEAEKPKPEMVVAPTAGKGHAKIDPSLWDLASKLVDGNYERDSVKVKAGWVEVFARLADDSQEKLDALKAKGVKILSHTAAGKMVHARIRVADLETVAELDFVNRIEPAKF